MGGLVGVADLALFEEQDQGRVVEVAAARLTALFEQYRPDVVVTYAADFDRDRDVDAADLTQWKADFGLKGDSDADGDGDSDASEFLTWQRQLSSDPLAITTYASVPEPAALPMLSLTIVAIRRHRRMSSGVSIG